MVSMPGWATTRSAWPSVFIATISAWPEGAGSRERAGTDVAEVEVTGAERLGSATARSSTAS